MSDSYGINFETLKGIASSLGLSGSNETSQESGIPCVIDSLNPENTKHDSFASQYYAQIEELHGDLVDANECYDKLINALSTIESYSGVNSGGGVDTGGVGGSGEGGGSVSTGGYSGGDYTVDPYTPTDTSEISVGYADTPYIGGAVDSTNPSTVDVTSPDYRDVSIGSGSGTGGGIVHTGSSIGSGAGALGAAAAVGGLGGVDTPGESVLPTTDYPLGNYNVDASFISGIPREELIDKLKDVGFTDEEIEAIMNGEYDVSKVLVEEISEKLAEAYKADSGIREYLKDKYGFDIYNEDGSVNNDRLSLALYMDDKSGLDNYSIISTLSEKYGINIVDQVTMKSYISQFESMFMKDSKIRDKFKEKYGFDIYNPDGTINKDRLALAMLIDEKSNGKYSISKFLKDAEASLLVNKLGNNMTKVAKARAAGGGKLPYMVGAAAAGAAAIGTGIAINKRNKKDDDDNEDKNRFITELDYDDDEKDNYWVQDVINNEELEDN